MKALVLGDLQLGKGGEYGSRPGDRLRDQSQTLERAVDLAIERGVDVALNCGDTFEGPANAITPDVYAAFQKPMRRLRDAGIPAITITGNGKHDAAQRDVTAPQVIQDVTDVYTTPSLRMIGDTCIAMLPWIDPGRIAAAHDGGDRGAITEDMTAGLIAIARGLRDNVPATATSCVLMLHFAVSGASLPTGIEIHDGVILPLDQLLALGFDAVLCSHIHKPQYAHDGSAWVDVTGPISTTGPCALYTSSLLPSDFSERNTPHGIWVVETYPTDPASCEFIPIPSRPFVQLDLEPGDGEAGVLWPEMWDGSLQGAVVKVTYKATREQASRVDHAKLTQAILDARASKVYAIKAEIARDTRARVDGVDETVGDLDALTAWIGANNLDPATAAKVEALTTSYLDRVAKTTTVSGGVMPTRVRATNCRTFHELDFEIPHGLVALVGDNGSGKSSIVNLVDVALFCGRGELRDLLTSGTDDIEITLHFESAGELYRIRRGLRAGKSQTVDLERRTNDTQSGWEPLSRENADATNQLILELIGLTRQTSRAGWFLKQSDGAAFTEAGAASRKTVLIESCGIRQWDGLLELAKADTKAAESAVAALTLRAETATQVAANRPAVAGRLAEMRRQAEEVAANLKAAEASLAAAQELVSKNAAAAERVRTAIAERDAAERDLGRITEQLKAAQAAHADRATAQEQLATAAAAAARVPELEALAEELRGQKALADTALAAREAARQRHAQLAGELERRARDAKSRKEQAASLHEKAFALREQAAGDEACDRCGQHLGEEARVTTIANLLSDAAAVTQALSVERPELAQLAADVEAAALRAEKISVPEIVDPGPVMQELANARTATVTQATLTARITALAEIAAAIPRLEQEHTAAERVRTEKVNACLSATKDVGDTTELAAAVERASSHIQTARRAQADTEKAIARDEIELERIEKAEAELADVTSQLEATRGELDVLRVACRAYGRDGVPALIIENGAIPMIEERANWILREGFDTPYHVELRTQVEQKNGATVETLDIVVHDGVAERPYETFSGGERTRLNLALRIGLAELLASGRGAASSLLVIDEPDGLDESGFIKLIDILRSIAGTFETILVVSHHPTVAASCDRQIRIAKDGNRSRVDIPSASELAPAMIPVAA